LKTINTNQSRTQNMCKEHAGTQAATCNTIAASYRNEEYRLTGQSAEEHSTDSWPRCPVQHGLHSKSSSPIYKTQDSVATTVEYRQSEKPTAQHVSNYNAHNVCR